MPIYEYRCKKCETFFEELVFSEEKKPECPSCGDISVEKQFSAFGVGAGSDPCAHGNCPLPEGAACGSMPCSSCM